MGWTRGPDSQGRGLSVTTVFQAAVNPVTTTNLQGAGTAGPAIGIPPPVTLGIQGAWADVPRGTRLLSGTLILEPEISPGGPVQVLNVTSQTGGFTASKLTRVVYTPPQQEDIQSLFEVVHKKLGDNETLAKEGGGIGGLLGLPNLTAWKDPVVVFGSLAAGETGGVSMVVNRRPTDGVTYRDFICIHGEGSLDGDINFDLILDSSWLGTIAGSWQDIPLATGVSGEPLELAIDPGRMLLTPISSASLSGLRWMKLYDAGVQSNIAAAPGRAAG